MAGLTFDDLVPKKSNALSFDDLVPQQKISKTQSAVTGAADTASLGLDPKIRGLGAALGQTIGEKLNLRPDTEISFPDLYAQKRNEIENATKMAEQQNPMSYLGGQVAGAVLPAISAPGSLFPSSGKVLGKGFVEGGKQLGKNILQMGAVSVPTAGVYGFNKSSGDLSDKMESAKDYAVPALAASVALPTAGVAIPYAAGKALDAITPSIDEGMVAVGKIAQKYNIPVSFPSLTKSESVKNFQKMSQTVPLSGENKFRAKQMEAFNKALTKSFGYESPRITPEVMNAAFKKVGNEFDSLGKGKVFNSSGFQQSIDDVLADASIYTDDALNAFSKEVDTVRANFAPDGSISGERLGQLRTRLNRLARKTNDADKAELFKSLENSVIDMMTAGDDVAKSALSEAKRKYKNLLVVEPLANKAVGGEINPSLLANRAEKIYGRAYTTGNAGEIGDLARIGKELLIKEGGSDTAPKMVQLGLGGTALTAFTNPSIGVPAAGIAAGGIAANRAVQSGILRNQNLVNRALNKADDLLTIIDQGGKITNQMIATLPQAEKNKFLKQVMQMPVAKAQAFLGEKINPVMQKSKQFAKEYISDESGAVKMLPDTQNYRISHTAPLKSGANTLDNISDIYPDDIYNPSIAWRYYGHGGDSVSMDKKTAQIISKFRNNPEAEITIYRAVPKGVKNINSGDWVTVNKDYAISHGKAHIYQGLSGSGKKEFDIIEKKVKAKNLSTDGNSIHEWGYND